MRHGRFGFLMVWGLFMTWNAYGQQGVSSASVSRVRSEASRPIDTSIAAIAAPDAIAVEEIVNYHRHHLPLPGSGQAVRMEVRWGNDTATSGQPSVLQIGLATADFKGSSDLGPLNLGLVIDRSGSMASANKMKLVKAALQSLASNLRPSDIVSIVAFDGAANVVLPASRVGNGNDYRRAVESIQPSGSTNIDAGLVLGYREVARHFRSGSTNRVILLTDGRANAGVIDPRRIAANSAEFNEQGIDLSTIGVGQDLDNDLLRTLSKSGRGLYHFVADPNDIAKIFVNEVESLLSPVARNVRVEITQDGSLHLERLYGYSPRAEGNSITLEFDDLNSAATQVILLQYAPESVGQATVRLRYFDLASKREVEDTQRVVLKRGSRRNLPQDPEVLKNHTIATLAQALSTMQQSWKRGDLQSAENAVRAAVRQTLDLYPEVEDADIRAQFEVAQNYLSTLEKFNRRNHVLD
jgi:Ca-activated chloride channel family protein